MSYRISARDLAHQLGLIKPTDQQVKIIESELTPSIVVAGAGSGKTETMAARVVWLVANQMVRPDEILGLTFTRKAASELNLRIRTRLRQLRRAGLLPESLLQSFDVSVSTYNSYAGKVLSEHGIRLGVEVSNEPIGEAALWQIAARLVHNYETHDEPFKGAPGTVIENLLKLASKLSDNDCSTQRLRDSSEHFIELIDQIPSIPKTFMNDIDAPKERLKYLELIDQFNAYRYENGQLSFSDQVRFAAQLVKSTPDIAKAERAKYKVVLLDEYQDTSVTQAEFLSHIFGVGHVGNDAALESEVAVTAVGDPNQAIYGWRGAGAETLASFPSYFSKSGEVESFEMLTTFRNDIAILELANRTIERIEAMQVALGRKRKSEVSRLIARDDAGPGAVLAELCETDESESQVIARFLVEKWNDPQRLELPEEKRTTAAVLVRVRSQIDLIEKALTDVGLPVEVVGIGGLLNIPEIADIVALLRVLIFPDSGTSLMRLLTGPHVALGAKDLAAFGGFLATLSRANPDEKNSTLMSLLENHDHDVADGSDYSSASAIHALDLLLDAPPNELTQFSAEGVRRLRDFAKGLRVMRTHINGSILDVILAAEEFLHLDVEVEVRKSDGTSRIHLDRFLDEATKFARIGSSIAEFLEWLKVAAKQEGGLKQASVERSTDRIQILTIHNAKGAEWDYVVVPGLRESMFPNNNSMTGTWLSTVEHLPAELRVDGAELPSFTLAGVSDKKELENRVNHHVAEWKHHRNIEEHRLAYVAFTRAKKMLLCTSAYFKGSTQKKDPSELFELVAQFIDSHPDHSTLTICEPPTTNRPVEREPDTAPWPRTPRMHEKLLRAELLYREATDGAMSTTQSQPLLQELADDVALLIAEQSEKSRVQNVPLPSRLSASTLLALQKNPSEVALNIRRPIPRHADRFARKGTRFHLWIENYFNRVTLLDDEELDRENMSDKELKELQEKWLASQWAPRTPIDIEAGFEMELGGVLIRGRIDAIYGNEDGTFTVVDWKTGKIKSGDDLENAAIQLAIYRLAYSRMHQIALEKISAAFYYVNEDQTVSIADLMSESELIGILTQFDK